MSSYVSNHWPWLYPTDVDYKPIKKLGLQRIYRKLNLGPSGIPVSMVTWGWNLMAPLWCNTLHSISSVSYCLSFIVFSSTRNSGSLYPVWSKSNCATGIDFTLRCLTYTFSNYQYFSASSWKKFLPIDTAQ